MGGLLSQARCEDILNLRVSLRTCDSRNQTGIRRLQGYAGATRTQGQILFTSVADSYGVTVYRAPMATTRLGLSLRPLVPFSGVGSLAT